MRSPAGLALALLVVVAGCSAPVGDVPVGADTPPETDGEEAEAVVTPPDPPTDRLGWEDGYWYNETLAIDTTDGVNDSERTAVVGRTMARVEVLRELEFERTVPVRVVSRERYREEFGGSGGDRSATFQRFDNAKFEALFLVGEREDSLAVQSRNRGSNVLGLYSSRNDSIVVVEGEDASLPSETTLGHELVHALQDQHHGLGGFERRTREEYNAVGALVEGDARYTDQRYRERCADEWDCFRPETDSDGQTDGGQGSEPDVNFGVYFLNFFPYSDGAPWVATFHERGGWDRVNRLYDAPPESTEQVIHPRKYREDAPTDVALTDRTRNGWTRVRPDRGSRPDHAVLGQSALSSMFAYTFVDGTNASSVVEQSEFVNTLPNGQLNQRDPFDYDLRYTRGWDGDRLHVYERDGETAYVWKLVWDSPADAERFAAGYRALLSHWGGERVDDGVWRIEDGEFEDSFRLRIDGDTVVVTNAPSVQALDDVRREP